MLSGVADAATLPRSPVKVERFDPAPATLEGVQVLQALFEMRYAGRQEMLPAGLHPTIPPTLILQAWRCEESPWGPFALAQVRVGCRSGVRTRGLVVGAVCDEPKAARGLAEGWGYRVLEGAVHLDARYDGTSLGVERQGRTLLALETRAPDPLAAGDVQYTGTLTLADTERGLRLIQVEPIYTLERAERVAPGALELDAEAWGQPRLTPYHPVSASIARGRIEIPAPRFVCRPDELAFSGTEPV